MPQPDTSLTPLGILSQQAEYLTTNTHGIIEGRGEVKNNQQKPAELTATLYGVVPSLNFYAIDFVRISYALTAPYTPCLVHDCLRGHDRGVTSEEGLICELRDCLRSKACHDALQAIFAHITAAIGETP
jgi:hypothetical protein